MLFPGHPRTLRVSRMHRIGSLDIRPQSPGSWRDDRDAVHKFLL